MNRFLTNNWCLRASTGLIRAWIVLTMISGQTMAWAQETESPPPQNQFLQEDPLVQELQTELRQIIQDQFLNPDKDAKLTPEELKERAREVLRSLRDRLFVQLQEVVQNELGAMQAIETETVVLDALDKRGRLVQIPQAIPARPLRMLTAPETAAKTGTILAIGSPALALYDEIPSDMEPETTKGFLRQYTGDAAAAIETEAKLLVTLKGGEWVEPTTEAPVANVIAVRGLDLDRGLGENGNQRYDDTMYVIVRSPTGDVEVYEYRMTTESSSSKKGVGRLSSKQVWYLRGKHKKRDPAYQLKGGSAEGTRVGQEGSYRILGANIHSAYSRRPITSETPLPENVSLGCQVVAAGKSDFEKELVKMLDKLGITAFPYTIIEDAEIGVLEAALAKNQKQSVLADALPRKSSVGATPSG